MADIQRQLGAEDFLKGCALPQEAVEINRKVWFQDRYGLRAVFVEQTPFYTYSLQATVEHRFCAAQLVEAGLASCQEVCATFQISARTFARVRNRLRQGGIAALVPATPGPKVRRERTQAVTQSIVRMYQQRQGTCDIAQTLGLGRATVRRVLREQGIPLRGARDAAASSLFEDSPAKDRPDNVSGAPVSAHGVTDVPAPVAPPSGETPPEDGEVCRVLTARDTPPESSGEAASGAPDAGRSAAAESAATCGTAELAAPVEATSIPYAAPLDRLATVMGWIEEAPVSFASAAGVPQAGVLLGLALLGETHLVVEARAVYGRLKNGWYGLRSLLWTLMAMALLRIKRPEQIKLHDPVSLGQVLGLPRSAEVKTVRRKLAEVTARGQAAEWHRRLAQRRAAAHADELATLYVDGHVRVYYGQHRLGKTYATRLKSVVHGETDYWVHLRSGRPLLVVHDAANGPFAEVLRAQVLPEVRRVIGKQRVMVVFDRAGWCKELMWALLKANFDFITYRKGAYEPLDENCFRKETIQRDGHTVAYELAEDVFAEDGWPPLRLIAVKKKNGAQTHLVASGRATWEALNETAEPDLPAVEMAWWMFGRWCQENWLKYMREEFLLDVLVEYGTEPDDPQREVVNPERRKLDRQLQTARARLNREEAKHAQWVRGERKTRRKDCAEGRACGKCGRCGRAAQERAVAEARTEVEQLLQRREQTPRKIPLGQASDRDPVKLCYERKLFTDTVKICAYEIETRLLEMALGTFRRSPWEGRALIRDILQTSGDLRVSNETLEVHLDQLSTPRATRAMIAICDQLNALQPQLPESPLRLRFLVNPRPVGE